MSRILEACPDVDRRRLPAFRTTASDDGSPHVEVVGDTLHYVVTERGCEYERRSTRDEDELMYWLVSDATDSAACDWELRHRVAGQDSRRLLFAKEVALLGMLSANWAARRQAEIDSVLSRHPYSDELG